MNEAANMIDGAHTVKVEYQDGSGKLYTYLTTLALPVGTLVVVPVRDDNRFTLATIRQVDHDVQLHKPDVIQYRWVVAPVDLGYYQDLMSHVGRFERR